jgi:hypothetical protein
MKTRVFAGMVGALLLLAPLSAADSERRNSRNGSQDSDMQRAIAEERYKDMASAREARKEARHPTVFYNNADRQANSDDDMQGRKVKPTDPIKK